MDNEEAPPKLDEVLEYFCSKVRIVKPKGYQDTQNVVSRMAAVGIISQKEKAYYEKELNEQEKERRETKKTVW